MDFLIEEKKKVGDSDFIDQPQSPNFYDQT